MPAARAVQQAYKSCLQRVSCLFYHFSPHTSAEKRKVTFNTQVSCPESLQCCPAPHRQACSSIAVQGSLHHLRTDAS
jgi:hypothetical protein